VGFTASMPLPPGLVVDAAAQEETNGALPLRIGGEPTPDDAPPARGTRPS